MVAWVVGVVLAGAANVVQKRVVDGGVSFDGTLFVNDQLEDMTVVFNTTLPTAVYPSSIIKDLPAHLYTYRMTSQAEVTSGLVTSSIRYALVAPVDLPEFTLLIDVYKTDFVYLGKPPPELEPHLLAPNCGTPPAFATGLDFAATVPGTSPVEVTVSHSIETHTIADTSICGQSTLAIGTLDPIPVWIDCTKSVHGSANRISGVALGLGIYTSSDTFCIYRGNNSEINHAMAITIVAALFIFLSVWIDWTQLLWERTIKGTTRGVWETTTVAYSLIVYQFIGLMVSMNIYARAQQSHNIYSFSSLRMVSLPVVDRTADVYSYVLTPLLGGLSLLTMVIGRLKTGPADSSPSKFNFTWGHKALETRSLSFRLMLTGAVLGTLGTIIYAVWIRGIDDRIGGIMTAITAVPVVLSWATPRWVARILSHVNIEHMPPMLVYFSWSVKLLLITCICNNLPFDVAGHLNTTFHSGITFSMGCALLVITARDMAHILLCIRDLSRPKITGHLVFLGLVAGFVVWYTSIFNLGGMFSHSGSLQNKGGTATLCSVAFSIFLFSEAFSISVNDGLTATVTKGPKGL